MELLKYKSLIYNTYNKKIFSSANLSILVGWISAVFTYLYISRELIIEFPQFSIVCLGTMVICFGIYLYLKFPIFIIPSPVENFDENLYDNVYVRNVNWFGRLFFSLFTPESSQFVSFFSETTLTLFTKGRICKFICVNKNVKFIHRVFDVLLMIVLTPILCMFIIAFLFAKWYFSIFIYLIYLIFIFRKHIILYIFSVNANIYNNLKINIIFPWVMPKFPIYKYYGFAEPFTKTILISEDTFRLNPIIKDYVLAHEKGHLDDRKNIFVKIFISVIIGIWLSFAPYFFYKTNALLVWLPLTVYIIYNITIGYYINLKSELFADKVAIKSIGKENVLEALNTIKKFNHEDDRFLLVKLFFRYVPIERRIRFVNEYSENEI